MITLKMIPSISILLLILVSSSSSYDCPDVKYTDKCDEGFVCHTPIDASPPSCNGGYGLQIREGQEPFESIDGFQCKLEDKDNMVIGKRTVGGAKIFDADFVTCAKEACRLKPKKSNGKCLPRITASCIEAKNEPEKFTCDSGYHLEWQDLSSKAWIEIKEHSCTGDKQTIEGQPQTEPLIRCRKDRACKLAEYFDKKECEDKKKCTEPKVNGQQIYCESGEKLEVVLDDWQDVPTGFVVECNTNKMVVKNNNIMYEPQLLRCIKDAVCETQVVVDLSGCPTGDHCISIIAKDPASVVCDKNYKIEGHEQNQPWSALDSVQCYNDVIKNIKQGVPDQKTYKKLRCRKEKVCEIANEHLYEKTSTCDLKDDECETPALANDKLSCPDESYELQAKITNAWKKVQSISCAAEGFMDGINVIASARCVRKNIVKFFLDNNCEAGEECKQATDYASMKCESNFKIQVKKDDWIDVKSIAANSDKFIVNIDDTKLLDTQPVGIRCMRMKCSMCTSICPSCSIPSNFVPSTKWNECASFGCGSNEVAVIGNDTLSEENSVKFECHSDSEESQFFWKAPNGSKIEIKEGEFKCEKLCTKISPLKSTCNPKDYLCEKLVVDSISNDLPITCTENIARKSNNSKVTLGKNIECDKEKGEWILTKLTGGTETIEDGDTVYCAYGDCTMDDLCEGCVQDENSTFCPDGKIAKVIDSTGKSTANSTSFSCQLGKWMDDQKNIMQDKIKCDSPDSAPQTGGSSSVLIALGIILGIVIVLLLLSCIVCKLMGNGWLHSIILAKVRGDKKKKKNKKEKKGKKGSSKANSPSVASGKGSTKYTEKEAGTPDQGSSVEGGGGVRRSGETVEGVSCTGFSVEGFTTDGGGGGGATPDGPSPSAPATPDSVDPMNPPQQVIA